MKIKSSLLFFLPVLLLITGLVGEAQAAPTVSIGHTYPSLMRGVRPIGMGNAFVAMPGTDENAMFYNPAAINDYEKKHN